VFGVGNQAVAGVSVGGCTSGRGFSRRLRRGVRAMCRVPQKPLRLATPATTPTVTSSSLQMRVHFKPSRKWPLMRLCNSSRLLMRGRQIKLSMHALRHELGDDWNCFAIVSHRSNGATNASSASHHSSCSVQILPTAFPNNTHRHHRLPPPGNFPA
jgi:hypothetical protein